MKPVSLRTSVVILALCCVLGGQLISALVLLVVPYHAPRAMTVAEALGAIDGRSDSGFEVATMRRVPLAPTPDGYAQWIVECAAAVLGRSPSTVRVHPLAETASIHADDGAPSPGMLARMAADPHRAAALRSILFPPFELALQSADGSWEVVRPARSYLPSENARLVLSFAVALACLAPLIWWSARRLIRPLRFLADASLALGEDPGMAPLHVAGPEEVRAATTAFNHMRAQLARHVSERATLMAALAHDLRTPLTAIRIRAEMMPEEGRRKMAADIHRLDELVSDMLVFARGGSPGANRCATDLRSLCKACVDDMGDLGERVHFNAKNNIIVWADASAVRRAIENLLANALAHGKNVEVQVISIAGRAEVRVSDDGPGIPEELLEKVFEPFFRVEASRSRKTGGAGLGLAIARAIARSHGGDVELNNRETGGLEVWLSLKEFRAGSSEFVL